MDISESEDESYNNLLKKQTKKRPRYGRVTDVNKKLRATTHELGPSCECKRFKCFEVLNEDQRYEIIRQFNELGNYQDQNLYLGGLITVHSVAQRRSRKTNNEGEPHQASYSYRVRCASKDVPVCQNAFRSLHGITGRRIQTLQSQLINEGKIQKDRRGKHDNRPRRLKDSVLEHIHGHIKSLKGRKSHYSLHESNKLYLPEELNISKLFEMFQELYPEDKVSYESYRSIFNTHYNITFGYPRDSYNGAWVSNVITNNRYKGPILQANEFTHPQKLYDSLLPISAAKYDDCIDLRSCDPISKRSPGNGRSRRRVRVHFGRLAFPRAGALGPFSAPFAPAFRAHFAHQLKNLFTQFLREKGFTYEEDSINSSIQPLETVRAFSPSPSASGKRAASVLCDDGSSCYIQMSGAPRLRTRATFKWQSPKSASEKELIGLKDTPNPVPLTDEVKNDFINQRFPICSVYKLHGRDGRPLSLLLAVLNKTGSAKEMCKNLSKVCGLSGITVEPPKKGRPGQCHRCQNYEHAAAHCYAQPRCVKCTVLHWTKECTRTRKSDSKPSYVLCGGNHTANYRCPRAPKFIKHTRRTDKVRSTRKSPPANNIQNYPTLGNKTKGTPSASEFRPAPGSTRLKPSGSALVNDKSPKGYSLGEDIKSVISILRLVKSEGFAELASDFRRKKVSIALEEIDTPAINKIPNEIESTNDIDNATGTLTSHITKVVKNCLRKVPVNSDHRKLPASVRKLMRAKNAALRRASDFPTPANRSYERALQRKVRERVREVRNDNWSALMEEITPTHKAYRQMVKALKSDGYEAVPALKNPDNTLAFEDREKAKVSLNPKDDLNSVTSNDVKGLVKNFKTRRAPGLYGIGNKAMKCFFSPLLAILVAIFNACLKNCYFPEVWKDAVTIGIPKPEKPRDLPANYRSMSLLSSLGTRAVRKNPQVATKRPPNKKRPYY
ncbi:RNA-directed DNA polymerase from mobile element jockey [Eumeta japonica]|uniref:RNA-directed DNA polymerase from mobile element jockey n=1 Tax=Eumeta variegata TaxID=151549 RepID=A0A4C1XU48_EUMVA|nr:RNA-directed DNA polymerase from mobile element jockey [Eumeta japonica]